MKITSAELARSALREEDWPRPSVPEVAFLGRSNVGKSSAINSLLGTKGLARTSRTPGRTRALNFFLINRSFQFVDLPGYGYSRVSREEQQEWSKYVTGFLAKRTVLVLSIHLVDSRHEPTTLDQQLNGWLQHHTKPFQVVATKSDKLSKSRLGQSLLLIARGLGSSNGSGIIPFSAVTRLGADHLWRVIEGILTAPKIPQQL